MRKVYPVDRMTSTIAAQRTQKRGKS